MVTFVTSTIADRAHARRVEDLLRRHTDQIARLGGLGPVYFAGVFTVEPAEVQTLIQQIQRELDAEGPPISLTIATVPA